MINSEVSIIAEAHVHDKGLDIAGIRFVVNIGLIEAKMALNDERIRLELADKVGLMVADHIESFLNSTEAADALT